jgi:hypothetical protein
MKKGWTEAIRQPLTGKITNYYLLTKNFVIWGVGKRSLQIDDFGFLH